MKRAVCGLVIVLSGLLFLTSCSTTGPSPLERAREEAGKTVPVEITEPLDQDWEKRAGQSAEQATVAPGQDSLEPVRSAAQSHLEQADFTPALRLIGEAIENGISETELASQYLAALNGVIEQGRTQLDGERYERAGRLFSEALQHYPHLGELVAKALLSREQLQTNVELCATQLMKRGLSDYREGNLAEAIAIWQRILAFAPQHQASRKAIQTAQEQLINLRKIDGTD